MAKTLMPDGVPVWVISGSLPTVEEWAEIAALRMPVTVLSMPDNAIGLGSLAPYAASITGLAVNSYSCSDLSAVDQLEWLESLVVGGRVTKAPKLTSLARLRDFHGPLKNFEGVLSLPTIDSLHLQVGRRALPKIEAAVSQLTLLAASTVRDLSQIARIEALASLWIEGARPLDIALLSAASRLREAAFERCSLENAGVLADLTALEKVFLEECQTIDQWQKLLMVNARVHVIGKNPFDERFRRAAPDSWTFPPGLRVPPPLATWP